MSPGPETARARTSRSRLVRVGLRAETAGELRGLVRPLALALLGLLPAALLTVFLYMSAVDQTPAGWHRAIDFHTFWVGARHYLHGSSPYPSPSSIVPFSNRTGESFVYPPPVAAVLAPFALLPYPAAATLFVAVSVVAVGAALWLFGVRDWRCYGAAFASPAVLTGITVGTLSPLLLLGLALVWRTRDRRGAAAAAAAVVVAKLFLWPVLVWLFVTGRRRAAVEAALLGAVLSLVAWAPLRLAGLGAYPGLLRRLSLVEGPRSYAASALLPGGWVVVAVCLAIVSGVALLRRVGDARLFALAVTASLLLSPIVWLHYFVLLVAPAAVVAPRVKLVWLLPLAFWATPQQWAGGEWRSLLALAVSAAVLAATVLAPAPPARAQLEAAAATE